MKHFGLNGCICLLAVLMVVQAKADVVLQADFDTVDQMVTKGGTAKLVAYSTNKASVETDKPLAAESKGFLRVDARADSSHGRAGGVKIKPESAATSLAAMTQVVDGKVKINGAFDLFFRSSEDVNPGMSVMRCFDENNTDKGGLRLVYLSHNGKPRIELIAPKTSNAFVRSNGKASNVIAAQAGLIMEPKTVYHLAIGFVTDDKDMVTMTMYAAEGPVAIDSKNALATIQFKIDSTNLKAGFPEGEFFFGKIGQAGTPTLQDFDCLRIYDKLPETFEALK